MGEGEEVVFFFDDVRGGGRTRFDPGTRTTFLQVVRRSPAPGSDFRLGGLRELELGDVVLHLAADFHEVLAAYARLRAAGWSQEALAKRFRALAEPGASATFAYLATAA